MCWVENIRSLDLQIANRDIEVYKIVSYASKQFCKSIIQGFIYEANIRYKIDAMELKRSSISSDFYTTNFFIYSSR